MWGGRFEGSPDAAMRAFTEDQSDRRLLRYDVRGSIAHARMLHATGLVPPPIAASIVDGLERLALEVEEGRFEFSDEDEDVHSAVERRLHEVIGEAAGFLHTGRSRNDQVALDLRLYLRDAVAGRRADLVALAQALADQAARHIDTVAPAYTHLQQSQPVSFAHHLLAHAWPLVRDLERLRGLESRLDESPLGAGASGGSSLALDPAAVAAELGFSSTFANSLDAIGSRDIAAEFVFCAAQALASLSRFGADLTLWSSHEFGWVTLSDSFTTGSSALPQKKNPDVAELVRGAAATVLGDLVALLGIQHGLPASYNRDLQNDKRAVFHADDILASGSAALRGLVATADFHPAEPEANTVALDVAEQLAARGIPFRRAHEAVGELVARLERDGRDLGAVTAEDVAGSEIELADIPTPAQSARRRTLPGSGNPELVTSQLEKLNLRLADLR